MPTLTHVAVALAVAVVLLAVAVWRERRREDEHIRSLQFVIECFHRIERWRRKRRRWDRRGDWRE